MKRLLLVAVCIAATAALPTAAEAETYRVGPRRSVATLKNIVPRLAPGDVVEIEPGTYREVYQFRANGTQDAPIVIRGVGRPRPVFDAKGVNVSGKGPVPRAIFEIRGAYYVIEHLEFKNARNGGTAAGIRLLHSTNAIIRDCKISYCDLGVFGDDIETATIEGCEVCFNSTKDWDGYAHNFYMHGRRVVVRNCYIHDSPYGQNFKTRAHYNELWYNWIADSNEGEVGPVDERKPGFTDVPNSNVLMVGNVIVSKPGRTGNPGKFVLFGSELKGSHNGTLYLFHNTLVAGDGKIVFIQLRDPKARAVIRNNIFFGSKRILETPVPALSVTGSNNRVPADATVPTGFTATSKGEDPGLVDRAKRDFRLTPGSPCVNRGALDLEYVDGGGVRRRLTVDQCYQLHGKLMPRQRVGSPDLGAYELGAPPPVAPDEAAVRIGGHVFIVKLAADAPTRNRGLAGRRELPHDYGMLFIYPRPQGRDQMGFWMKGCLIDLDVAFISPKGRIVTIHTMRAEPRNRRDGDLKIYRATATAQFALELAAGEFARRGIKVGDRVEFSTVVRRVIRRAR